MGPIHKEVNESFKESQKEIYKKLRRGFIVDDNRRDYETDQNSGSLVKKFPVVLIFELMKNIRAAISYPRADQKRICKHLYGHMTPKIWAKWVEVREYVKQENKK